MVRVIEVNVERIVEDCLRFVKGDTVLEKILICLSVVPFKTHFSSPGLGGVAPQCFIVDFSLQVIIEPAAKGREVIRILVIE
jgi:hypothetical protein